MTASPPTSIQTENGSLNGKKVFIAGGSSGIGLAIAKAVAARGAKVAIAARNKVKLDAAAAMIGEALLATYSIDLANGAAVASALVEHGPYDHIVSTAAQLAFKPIGELSEDEIQAMVASKLWGPIHLARAAVHQLNPEGSLLFVSGYAAYKPSVGTSVVGAVNLHLEILAKSLALELKPSRVNVLSPGIVDTPLWDGLSDADRKEFYRSTAASLPVGRIGHVNDLSHAAMLLMENGFITGTVLHADGGARFV